MLWDQLSHRFSDDNTIAHHWFIVIGCLVTWLTFCGHVMYTSHTWLIVMNHGFRACDPIRALDGFYEFWYVARYGAADSHESADGFHTMTHYESWVAWCESMSHPGLGLREEPLYKGTLGALDSGHEPSPLHTQQLKSKHYENLSSTSTTTALSVSCTRTLRELHPPPPALLPLSCPWALASLFLGVVWLYSSLSPLALRCLA